MSGRKGVRQASVERNTTETRIRVRLRLDGSGVHKIRTTIPFLDHMLQLLSKHGLLDLTVEARGDTDVDYHHTVEDIGIVLGEALKKALGTRDGITRYGTISIPMDETLATVSLDLSGRPYLVYHLPISKNQKIRSAAGNFPVELMEDFLAAFATHSGTTLHVNVPYGRDPHHVLEAAFKGLGRALRQAVAVDPRIKGAPSTKGRL
jgi:imidazoleglycerol-phosphate dehydratase